MFVQPGKDHSGGLEGAQTNTSVKSFCATRLRRIFGVHGQDQMLNHFGWRSVCTQSWELSRQNCYVVHVHATSMRPNRHQKRCQLRVLPAFDYDGMIQMLKQGLAAYKVATENVSRPGARPHWVVEATGRPSHVEESCQDQDGYLIFFGSCRAYLFINISSLQRPAPEGRLRLVGSGTGTPVQPVLATHRAAVKSQSSVTVMAAHQLYPTVVVKGVCLDAVNCGWDMTALNPDNIWTTIGN